MRVVGLDLGGTKTALMVAGADGRALAEERMPTLAAEGAAAAVGRALDAAAALLDRPPAAVGISVPGVVRPGGVRLAPNLPGLDRLDLAALVRRCWPGSRVVVETDAKAAVLAEYRWGNLAGCASGVFLNLGTGLSAGIVVGGRVLRGANGAAGEIGYQLRRPDEVGFAGGRAPLEEYCSGSGLARRAGELLGRPVDTAEVLAGADGPDRPGVLADDPLGGLADDALAELAMAVANLTITVDPDRVVLGGGLTSAVDRIRPVLARALIAAVPFPPTLELARFPDSAPLRGAVARALERLEN